MAKRLGINLLSSVYPQGERQGNAIVMGGTFAPVHKGHFDAIHAASAALVGRGTLMEALVFLPNSAEYVQRKLPTRHQVWPYDRRVQGLLDQTPHPDIPTYVDDITGRTSGLEDINALAPAAIQRHLGLRACQLYFMVGSDQLRSMQPHLEGDVNRAICVLRPNNLDGLEEQLGEPWAAEAVSSGRLIITDRPDMQNDISSTGIREVVAS